MKHKKPKMSGISLSRNQQLQLKELDLFIDFLSDFIDKIQKSKIRVIDFFENIKFCRELSRERKAFYKYINSTLKSFVRLSEPKQVDIELRYSKAVKKFNKLLPTAKKEIESEFGLITRYLLLRELDKFIKIIATAQNKMSNHLYKDNSQEILSNPDLYNQIASDWNNLENK